MAVAIKVNALQTPDGSTFAEAKEILIATSGIQEVKEASAELINLFPDALAVINVKYNDANHILTGTYIVEESVEDLETSINA
jgi:hypothetical protein